MKKTSLALFTAALLFASCNNEKKPETASATSTSPSDTSNSTTPKKEWVAADSATAMQRWMENAAVGEPHKALAASAGKWVGKSTMWMGKGAPPITSDVKMDVKMLLGGRYQESSYSGDMGGMPYTGMATVGYDNYKKKYISTSIDNMGTGVILMEGTMDPATKTITFEGDYPNPANGMVCHMKQAYTFVDANNEKMEMWGPDEKTGEMYQTMVIIFTRAK